MQHKPYHTFIMLWSYLLEKRLSGVRYAFLALCSMLCFTHLYHLPSWLLERKNTHISLLVTFPCYVSRIVSVSYHFSQVKYIYMDLVFFKISDEIRRAWLLAYSPQCGPKDVTTWIHTTTSGRYTHSQPDKVAHFQMRKFK